MDKNYNVKQITTIIKESDIVDYQIIIGVKDISSKPFFISLQEKEKVYEINTLINAIIENKNERRRRVLSVNE